MAAKQDLILPPAPEQPGSASEIKHGRWLSCLDINALSATCHSKRFRAVCCSESTCPTY